MQIDLILPIFIPFVTACLCLLAWRNVTLQKFIFIGGSALLMIAGGNLLVQVYSEGIIVVQSANWPAPFGITLAADMLSALMVAISGILGFVCAVFSLQSVPMRLFKTGFAPLFQFLIMGVCGAFLTGDVFNLYVWIEVFIIASFVLLALGSTKEQLRGTVKYIVLNFIASMILLTGIAFLYGMTGNLNMAYIATIVRETENGQIFNTISIFFIIPFSIKAAMFPLYFWLPASYHAPPIAITGFFAALLTKVGVYCLMRFFTLIFVQDITFTHMILLVGAGLTMFLGVLGAVAQNNTRKILSVHIISQIGYLIMGIALFTPLSVSGSIFYTIHVMIVKTNLFLICGITESMKNTSDLNLIGGIYKKYPMVSLLFILSALSLAGLPPFSGFWSKFILIKAGLEIEAYMIVTVAIITGILTLFSMTKIWQEAFWKADPLGEEKVHEFQSERHMFRKRIYLVAPVILLTLITLFIGLYSEPLFLATEMASEQLMNPEFYINAVLNR